MPYAMANAGANEREQDGVVGEEVHLPPALTKFGAARLVSGRWARTSRDAGGYSIGSVGGAVAPASPLAAASANARRRFASSCLKSRCTCSSTWPSSGPSRAAIASIASRAWSSSLAVELGVGELAERRDRREEDVLDLQLPDLLRELLRSDVVVSHAPAPRRRPARRRSPAGSRPARAAPAAARPRSPAGS